MGWSVWTTRDEYGNVGRLVGYHQNKHDAILAAQGQGWYGGEGKVLEQQFIRIRHTTELFALSHPDPVLFEASVAIKKARALAKLTDEEKKILGLKS